MLFYKTYLHGGQQKNGYDHKVLSFRGKKIASAGMNLHAL
jgi:hypothetical protein